MNTHSDESRKNRSHPMANAVFERKNSSESTFQFVDNRPQAIAQRKLQEMVNNSTQAMRAARLQAMANNYSSQEHQPIQKKENNTGLPDNLKTGIENISGYSMDDVKVHYNSDKPAQLNAHAYAQGTDIHLASGQEKHLPHEAWHVVQQKQGRVKPTMQMKGGVNVNEDTGLEKEADVMGEKSIIVGQDNSYTVSSSENVSSNLGNVFQRLRYQAPPNANIDISVLSLFRLLDYLNRPDPDPDPGGVIFDVGDKAVLEYYANQAYLQEFQDIFNFLAQPPTVGLATEVGNRNIGAGVNLQQILIDAQTQYNNGNLPGFREWVGGTHANLNAATVLDKLNELRTAAGIAGVVNVDETAIAGTAQTADLQHGNEQTEVKTIRQPIRGHQDFTGQVSAALGKFAGVPVGGGGNLFNATIYASIDAALIAGVDNPAGPNTRTVTIDPNTLIKTTTITRNADGHVHNITNEDQWNAFLVTLNGGGWAGHDRANRIDVILENGMNRQFNRNLGTGVWA